MFATVWTYKVRPGKRDRFVEIYGAEGKWASLFRQQEGFIRTDLFEDLTQEGHFMSADLWRTRSDYEQFQENYGGTYEELDRQCASLSEQSHYGFLEDVSECAPLVFKPKPSV